MVKSVTSYSRNGLRDWILQRVTAVIVASYVLFLTGYWLCKPVTYLSWTQLFSTTSMKIATLLTVISVAMHAWVGLWTIFTDYLKPPVVRLTAEFVVSLLLVVFVLWGVLILWSV